MKNQKNKGYISLAIMVVITLVLVFCSDAVYKSLEGKGTYSPAQPTGGITPTVIPLITPSGDDTENEQAALDAAIAAANGNYVPGTYEASVQGYAGQVTAKVTVTEKAITKVELSGPEETPTLGGKAIETLGNKIILAQSADVDAYASATITSDAIKKAVKAALEQAAVKVEGAAKTGIGFAISLSSSKSATADADGTAQTDATVAAVTVDKDGKILACVIDCAQTKIKFSNAGVITTDKSGTFSSKQELKENYGMKGASAIGKEWFEQANAFAAYCVGKTVAELQGADLSVDLAASCTIHTTDFVAAVVKAVENATECGASASDKLSLGLVTSISSSKDATAEANGLAQAYTTFSVVTVDANGKITSSILDAVQANVSFDATGAITSDTASGAKTKNQLKDDYGMKGISPIGKEWYEQAAAYAAFVVGKDAAGVNAIKVESGYAKEEDLAASCTIHVTDFNAAIVKALNNAK